MATTVRSLRGRTVVADNVSHHSGITAGGELALLSVDERGQTRT